MGGERGHRRRGVCLTAKAIGLIETALESKWSERSGDGRLTRAAKADILGVSVPTMQRMLAGTPVDRSTVRIALERLGIEWCESLCALPSRPQTIEPLQTSAVRDPSRLHRVRQGARQLRGRPAFVAMCLVAALLAIAFLAFAQPVGRLAEASAYRSRVEELDRILARAFDAYHRGDYRLAETDSGKALHLATNIEATGRIAEALRLNADLAMVRGDLESARAALREALRLRELLGRAECQPPILEALGMLEARAGNLDAAQAHLTAALSGFESEGELTGVASAQRHLGGVLLERGDVEEARTVLRGALARALAAEKSDLATAIRGQLALVHREEGQFLQARTILAECQEYWSRQPHPRWLALTDFQLGTVEARNGNVTLAHRLLRRSRDAYASLSDSPGVGRCDEWLARLTEPSTLNANLNPRP